MGTYNHDSGQIATLIYKYVQNELSANERAALEAWVAASAVNKSFFEETIHSDALLQELTERYKARQESDKDIVWQRLVDKGLVPAVTNVNKTRWIWWRYSMAAAVFLCMALVSYLFFYSSKSKPADKSLTEIKQADISPGEAKAVLTLADGRKVVLDSASSKMLAMQGSVEVKNQNGQLIYIGSNNSSEMVYNTLSTARGQTYATVLADGSKVWLNAASSIRYPVAFAGKERLVEIEGEAYFEVAHNKAMPFKVSVSGVQVEVTGTSFNIQAYSDEQMIRTTLLEGGVRIIPSSSGNLALLKPGQQAQIVNNRVLVKNDVDIEEVMGWKNGMFVFNGADIKEVMNQLQRWYNIDVQYLTDVKGMNFTGQISKYKDVSKVLALLKLMNALNFKLEGRTIIISAEDNK